MEPLIAVVIGFVLGGLAGSASAVLGWLKSNEAFEPRKFVNGLVTGIITGVVAILAIAAAIQDAAVDDTLLLILYVTTFVGIIGVDNIRTAATGGIRNQVIAEESEEE
jgi:hypothetical protein